MSVWNYFMRVNGQRYDGNLFLRVNGIILHERRVSRMIGIYSRE